MNLYRERASAPGRTAAGAAYPRSRSGTPASSAPAEERKSHGDAAPVDVGADEIVLPSVGRLRMKALLHELVERAKEVMAAEDRQHQLLDAVLSVASNLSLPEVLHRIVRSSCQLVGARYGALGVLGSNERLAEFIAVGVDDAVRERIGDLPTGDGILGLLIDHPEPIRLRHLQDHPRSSGFPPHHPAMTSFLGVPIRVRGEVFGNLYLTEKQGREDFTDEDEAILVALAAAAAIAIENARLYEESRQREQWSRASNEITAALLGPNAPNALRLVANRARDMAGARLACIALPNTTGTRLRFDVMDPGHPTERLSGLEVPVEGTVTGETFRSREPRVVETLVEAVRGELAERLMADRSAVEELGSAVLVPLAAANTVLGVLLVVRARQDPPFTASHLKMIETFAAQAALAIQFTRALEDRQRLAVYRERDRIASDLHNLVIQRIFAISLGLEGMSRLIAQSDVAERVQGFVDDLDRTIGDIRRSVFSLQEPSKRRGSIRRDIINVVEEAGRPLGYEPRLSLHGPLDSVVPDAVRPDLLATLREALSNTVRHAHAHSVSIEVSAPSGGEELCVVVADDGQGIPAQRRRSSGLANLADRAARWKGHLAIDSVPGRGTTLCWRIPLPPRDPDVSETAAPPS